MPRKSAVRRIDIKIAHKPAQLPRPRRATTFDDSLGTKVKLRRIEVGMSQDELGKKLGVSFQQVQKYEKGVNRIGAGRLDQIATALDVPVSFFYGGDARTRELETMLAIDASFSMRLLKAYSSVKDVGVRRLFVSLIEGFAATGA